MIDETDDDWLEHVYQTNVFGPFRFIREALKIFLPKNKGCIINIPSVNGDHPFCGAAYTSQTGSSEGTSVSVTMNGTVCRAHLNASTAAQDLISRLPLTLTYTQMAGFEEKIGDLNSELDLGYSSYVHDPNPGDIAYWSPQPRVVLYYGDAGAWDGIHVIGSFDEEDKEAADAELSETSYDFEVTI